MRSWVSIKSVQVCLSLHSATSRPALLEPISPFASGICVCPMLHSFVRVCRIPPVHGGRAVPEVVISAARLFSPDAQLKKAYKRLALKLHPDKNKDNPNCDRNFTLLNEAYSTLVDEVKRIDYNKKVGHLIHASTGQPLTLARGNSACAGSWQGRWLGLER